MYSQSGSRDPQEYVLLSKQPSEDMTHKKTVQTQFRSHQGFQRHDIEVVDATLGRNAADSLERNRVDDVDRARLRDDPHVNA